MTWPNKLNPITVHHMIANLILEIVGERGRAWAVAYITGDVVGVPQEPKDKKGFRNLLNKAMAISPDNNLPVLLVYQNQGNSRRGYRPPDHNEQHTIINSTFVLVKGGPGEVPRVALNLVHLTAPDADMKAILPTTTPTPTP